MKTTKYNPLNDPASFFTAVTFFLLGLIEWFHIEQYLPGVFDVIVAIGATLVSISLLIYLIMWLDPKSSYNRDPKRLFKNK